MKIRLTITAPSRTVTYQEEVPDPRVMEELTLAGESIRRVVGDLTEEELTEVLLDNATAHLRTAFGLDG